MDQESRQKIKPGMLVQVSPESHYLPACIGTVISLVGTLGVEAWFFTPKLDSRGILQGGFGSVIAYQISYDEIEIVGIAKYLPDEMRALEETDESEKEEKVNDGTGVSTWNNYEGSYPSTQEFETEIRKALPQHE